jgi:glycosidase
LLNGLRKGDLLVNGNLNVPEDDNGNIAVVIFRQANNHTMMIVSTKGFFIDRIFI